MKIAGVGPTIPVGSIRQPRWLSALNAYGSTIPARSFVRCSATDDGETITITRPNANDLTGIGVTGPEDIPPNTGEGTGYGRVSFDFPLWVAKGSGSWSAGDDCGAGADAFTATLNNSGFKVLGLAGTLAFVAVVGGGGGGVLWLPVDNQYAGEIPANSIVVVTGYNDTTGEYEVDRSSGENSALTMVTNDSAIANGASGQATFHGPAKVTIDDDGEGSISEGDTVGSTTSDFDALLGNVGWQLVGVIDNGPGSFTAKVRSRSMYGYWADEGE